MQNPRDTEADFRNLDAALRGEVVCNIGHLGKLDVKLLDRAVRAGKLVKWRGKWFPVAGAPFGIGPDKTCWSTPEVAAYFAEFRAGTRAFTYPVTPDGFAARDIDFGRQAAIAEAH